MADVVRFTKHPSATLKVGKGFSLKDSDPDTTPGYTGDKNAGEELLADLDAAPGEAFCRVQVR